MKQIRFIILAAFMVVCCNINAQWTGPYTGEKLDPTLFDQDYKPADLACGNLFTSDGPLTLNPDPSIGEYEYVSTVNGAFIPGGGGDDTGYGTGVVPNPVGDAMWVVMLLAATLIGVRRYRNYKTKE